MTPAEAKRFDAGDRDIDHWLTKVAGVTHDNPGGENRLRVLGRAIVGDRLRLVRERSNRHSRSAIRIELAESGEQLGYVGSDLAAELAPRMDRGMEVVGWILDLTGGTRDKPTRGANVLLVGFAASVSAEYRAEYARARLETRGLSDPSWPGLRESSSPWSAPPYEPRSRSLRLGAAVRLMGSDLARWYRGLPEWARFAGYGLAAAVPILAVLAWLLG